ncbi:MAG: hypothetical protein ABIJ96_17140 [Elusimicrobiota bacterium]
MPPGKEDDKLLKIVLGLAILLAGFILFYIGSKNLAGLFRQGRTVPSSAAGAAAGGDDAHAPPAVIPPMKLLRIEKKGPAAPPSLPDRPSPRITPDSE